MIEGNEKSSYYWIFSLVTFPSIIPLYYLLNPVSKPELYLKSFLCLQLLLSLFLLRMIVNIKDISFRIWLVSVIIIPLPIVIFLSRLYLLIEFIGVFYILLVLYSLTLYRFRKGSGFVGTVLVLVFGPLFFWCMMEFLPKISLEQTIDYSPIYILMGDGEFEVFRLSIFLFSFFVFIFGSKFILLKVFKREVVF